MKKILSAALALAVAMSMVPAAFAAGGTAYASTQAVEVDGKKVEFQMYALKDANGNPTNYVKLRDVAHVLNGTKAQFSVGYDGSISVTTGTAYTDVGGEMTTPYSGDRAYREGSGAVKVNGQAASLESIILTDDAGGDYTYFKLRDLGSALGFKVDWSAQRGVFIETGATQSTDINPMDYAYTAMKYLYDHLKFPSTMDIISVKCGRHTSSHIFAKTDDVYVVTITYKAANSLGALRTDTYVTMFNLTTGKTMFDAVGYTKSLVDSSWGAGKFQAFSKNTEALGLSGGGTLSTELTREQIQSLVAQIKK